jgi:hypothetical protein
MNDSSSKRDILGHWDEAVVLYEYGAARSPEHDGYVSECVKLIKDRRAGN